MELAVGSLHSRLTSSHAVYTSVPTDASVTESALGSLIALSARVYVHSISKGIVGTSLVGISSMGGGEERFRQAAEAGRSPKPDEGLLPRP